MCHSDASRPPAAEASVPAAATRPIEADCAEAPRRILAFVADGA